MKFLTFDFETFELPDLTGKSEKQRKFGENIRQKYIDIFNKKLSNFECFQEKEKSELKKKFIEYMNHKQTSTAVYWIDHHCPKCGCQLKVNGIMKKCINEYCGYEKEIK